MSNHVSQEQGDKSDDAGGITQLDHASVGGHDDPVKMETGDNNFEIFQRGEGDVDFRTVGWIQTSVIFLKIMFAVGVLSIPSALHALGSLPGAINVLCWMALNTYCGIVMGNFRNTHPGCHSIGDMAGVLGGIWMSEFTNVLFLITYTITAASGIFGASVGMNTLSNHGLCTNYFLLIATLAVFILSSVHKFEKMAWVAWLGFASVFVAVFIVVVGVTVTDRPAAAPQTGDFDLGYQVVGNPSFVVGITAAANIFMAGTGIVAFPPVVSEMKRPQDYNKAVYVCMSIVTASYLTFSLIVYKYCGKWVASPSLGSAGPVVKKIAYGIGLIGLLISSCLYIHLCAKCVFVRVLRNSKHLQKNSFTHWGIWFGCTLGLSVFSFILASAIPIFNFLLALAGSLTFSPLALGLPGCFWLYDHQHYRRGSFVQKVVYGLHCGLILLSAFLCVGGTYGVVEQIIEAYRSGEIPSVFSCADNSNTV